MDDATFNAMLAEQASKSRPEKAPSEPGSTYRAAVAEIEAPGHDIRAAMLAEAEDSPAIDSVMDGLTFEGQPAAPKTAEQLKAESRRMLEEAREADPAWQAEEERRAAEAAELAQLRAERKEDEARVALEYEEDPLRRAEAWGSLGDEARRTLLEDGEVTDEEARELVAVTQAMIAVARGERVSTEARERAEAAAKDRADRLGAWQREQRLPKAEASKRYLTAREFARREGHDLEALSGEEFSSRLAIADATLQEQVRAEGTANIHRQILGEEIGVVAEGIETETTRLARAMERLSGDQQVISLDEDRIARRAASRPTTAAEIRAAVAEPDQLKADIQHAYSTGTEARKRHEQEQADARAASMR